MEKVYDYLQKFSTLLSSKGIRDTVKWYFLLLQNVQLCYKSCCLGSFSHLWMFSCKKGLYCYHKYKSFSPEKTIICCLWHKVSYCNLQLMVNCTVFSSFYSGKPWNRWWIMCWPSLCKEYINEELNGQLNPVFCYSMRHILHTDFCQGHTLNGCFVNIDLLSIWIPRLIFFILSDHRQHSCVLSKS